MGMTFPKNTRDLSWKRLRLLLTNTKRLKTNKAISKNQERHRSLLLPSLKPQPDSGPLREGERILVTHPTGILADEDLTTTLNPLGLGHPDLGPIPGTDPTIEPNRQVLDTPVLETTPGHVPTTAPTPEGLGLMDSKATLGLDLHPHRQT